MKISVLLCVLALLIPDFGLPARAQESDAPATGVHDVPDMDAIMKMWEEVSTPVEQHQRIGEHVGSWETKTTMWMDPENPTVTTGSAEIKWVLGGRFLQHEASGEMMGKPFSGLGYTGYDIYNKKYVSFWIDNSSTAMYTMEGGFDQSGKVLSMYGKMDEWITGERDKNVKYVIRFISPDAFSFEVHDLAIGETNTKVVEIDYTRKKAR